MTYNVFGGTLNLALSNHQVLRPQVQVQVLVPSTTCLLCSVFGFACNQLSPHAAVRIECILGVCIVLLHFISPFQCIC